MTKPNFQRVISLTTEENQFVEELKIQGVKIVDIFRKGLKSYNKEEGKINENQK